MFNPSKREGFGMSNGEGNEHIWSQSMDVIAPERIMMVHHCLLFLGSTLNAKYLGI